MEQAFDQGDQLRIGQATISNTQVGAGRAGLERLVGGEDEVLAQHGHVDRAAPRIGVVERPRRSGAPRTVDTEIAAAAGFVLAGQRGEIGDLRQRALLELDHLAGDHIHPDPGIGASDRWRGRYHGSAAPDEQGDQTLARLEGLLADPAVLVGAAVVSPSVSERRGLACRTW